MNGKFVLLALVFIFAASGASIGLQAASGRVEVPKAKQLAAGTTTASQPENADSTADATSLVRTPEISDCLPVEATLEASIAVTEEVTATKTPRSTLTVTPDCLPFDATPDVVFTPEATFDIFFATLEATDDSGRGRGRGGDDDEDEDHSGKGGGDDNSGHGSGDD